MKLLRSNQQWARNDVNERAAGGSQREKEIFEECTTELLVYFVYSPESGPDYRLYSDADIQADGGVHALARRFENESYW